MTHAIEKYRSILTMFLQHFSREHSPQKTYSYCDIIAFIEKELESDAVTIPCRKNCCCVAVRPKNTLCVIQSNEHCFFAHIDPYEPRSALILLYWWCVFYQPHSQPLFWPKENGRLLHPKDLAIIACAT